MERYTVCDTHDLWRLCNKHQWFTCGTNKQYDKLFYANENGATIEEIATIIWLCSDDEKWCRRDILNELKLEREIYLADID